jgi:hypothetical protein
MSPPRFYMPDEAKLDELVGETLALLTKVCRATLN